MEIDNPAFMIIDDLAIETPIYHRGFPIAMFDYRKVQETTVLYHGVLRILGASGLHA